MKFGTGETGKDLKLYVYAERILWFILLCLIFITGLFLGYQLKEYPMNSSCDMIYDTIKITEVRTMELMDWKDFERVSEQQILDAERTIVAANILLKECKIHIKKLGGETSEEVQVEHDKRVAEPL